MDWGPERAPTLDQVLHQLDRLIRIKSSEEASRRVDYTQATQANAASVATKTFKIRDKTPTRLVCVICKSETHVSRECTYGNASERRKVVMDADRCFRCFGQGHRYMDCSERRACRHCYSTSHASVLCPHERESRDRTKNKQAPRAASRSPSRPRPGKPFMRPQSPTPSRTPSSERPVNEQSNVGVIEPHGKEKISAGVLLNFGAKAKAEKTQGIEEWVSLFGIFDSGCGNSFITTTLVRKLNAKVIGRQRIRVLTFGSHTPIDEYCDIVQVTIAGISRTVTENFIVRDHIQTLTPYTETKLGERLIKEGEILADPRHRRPSQVKTIDILIGNSNMYEFMLLEAPRRHRKIVAHNTIFGWTISGSLGNPGCEAIANVAKVEIVPEEHEISSVDKHFAALWSLESLASNVLLNEQGDVSANLALAEFGITGPFTKATSKRNTL
ncbi:hypothetical protein DAPPUDRAFT_267118 [Daphnia pulex]|uniref:CCHC-type domain-containing protein n=1 Tax=Daphnia pulex TaxID=6669 RepID=E9HW08_DAPPU|nr:hypothetical protein DAPPUDRAFT_267118 [Daphnia pulex]|eukprot:EFX64064.1 hypothetical protein DAPPUDRAFT_267118 [Daphnia pulex]